MRGLLKLAHGIDRISEVLGKFSILLILVLVVVGFYNVVARYMGRFIGQNLSSNRLIETQWYLYSVIFFLIFAYNVKHDVNVRVDILYTKWSPKRKAWVDLLGHYVDSHPLLHYRHLDDGQPGALFVGTPARWVVRNLGNVAGS